MCCLLAEYFIKGTGAYNLSCDDDRFLSSVGSSSSSQLCAMQLRKVFILYIIQLYTQIYQLTECAVFQFLISVTWVAVSLGDTGVALLISCFLVHSFPFSFFLFFFFVQLYFEKNSNKSNTVESKLNKWKRAIKMVASEAKPYSISTLSLFSFDCRDRTWRATFPIKRHRRFDQPASINWHSISYNNFLYVLMWTGNCMKVYVQITNARGQYTEKIVLKTKGIKIEKKNKQVYSSCVIWSVFFCF